MKIRWFSPPPQPPSPGVALLCPESIKKYEREVSRWSADELLKFLDLLELFKIEIIHDDSWSPVDSLVGTMTNALKSRAEEHGIENQVGVYSGLESLPSLLGCLEALDEAKIRAEEIVRAIKTEDIKYFNEMAHLDGVTLLMVMARSTPEINRNAVKMMRSHLGKSGGVARGAVKREELRERNEKIIAKADQLRASGKDPRSIAGTLAKLFKLSAKQIRNIINAN